MCFSRLGTCIWSSGSETCTHYLHLLLLVSRAWLTPRAWTRAKLTFPRTLPEPHPTNGCVLRELTTVQPNSDLSRPPLTTLLQAQHRYCAWALSHLSSATVFLLPGVFLVQKGSPIALTSPAPPPCCLRTWAFCLTASCRPDSAHELKDTPGIKEGREQSLLSPHPPPLMARASTTLSNSLCVLLRAVSACQGVRRQSHPVNPPVGRCPDLHVSSPGSAEAALLTVGTLSW